MKLEGTCIYSVHVSVLCAEGAYQMLDVSPYLIYCRRRLGRLLCDLLVMPGLPAGLTDSLLAEQKRVWPQESYRYPTRGVGELGGSGQERHWIFFVVCFEAGSFPSAPGQLTHTCTCMYTSYCMKELGEVYGLAKASPLTL